MFQRRQSRVFVGVDKSLASLQALRRAAAEAQHRRVDLYVVHVRNPARSAWLMDSLGQPIPGGWLEPPRTDWLNASALQVIATSLDEALGGTPADLTVHRPVRVAARRAAGGGRSDPRPLAAQDQRVPLIVSNSFQRSRGTIRWCRVRASSPRGTTSVGQREWVRQYRLTEPRPG